jgi:hypothetical protein
MADMSDKMGDMMNQAKENTAETKDNMQERLEEKMHSDDRERSANEE